MKVNGSYETERNVTRLFSVRKSSLWTFAHTVRISLELCAYNSFCVYNSSFAYQCSVFKEDSPKCFPVFHSSLLSSEEILIRVSLIMKRIVKEWRKPLPSGFIEIAERVVIMFDVFHDRLICAGHRPYLSLSRNRWQIHLTINMSASYN